VVQKNQRKYNEICRNITAIETKTERQLVVLNHHKEETQIIKSNQGKSLTRNHDYDLYYLNEAIDKCLTIKQKPQVMA
jgi:hypothetical protein